MCDVIKIHLNVRIRGEVENFNKLNKVILLKNFLRVKASESKVEYLKKDKHFYIIQIKYMSFTCNILTNSGCVHTI